jgi:hypothetical protein
MGFQIKNTDIEAVINAVPEAIERVLRVIQVKTERFLERGGYRGSPDREGGYQDYDNAPSGQKYPGQQGGNANK